MPSLSPYRQPSLKGAGYNPRAISDEDFAALVGSVRELEIVKPIRIASMDVCGCCLRLLLARPQLRPQKVIVKKQKKKPLPPPAAPLQPRPSGEVGAWG